MLFKERGVLTQPNLRPSEVSREETEFQRHKRALDTIKKVKSKNQRPSSLRRQASRKESRKEHRAALNDFFIRKTLENLAKEQLSKRSKTYGERAVDILLIVPVYCLRFMPTRPYNIRMMITGGWWVAGGGVRCVNDVHWYCVKVPDPDPNPNPDPNSKS